MLDLNSLAHTIDDVVALINQGGTSHHTAQEIAAQYIYSAAKEQDDTSIENLSGQAEYLADAGAKFDSQEVLKIVQKIALENDDLNTL